MYINKITEYLQNLLKENEYEITPKVVISNRPDLSHLQCDNAFGLAKIKRMNPFDIANDILNIIINDEEHHHYFKDVFVERPGFINFVLSDEYINNEVTNIVNDQYLGINKANKETIIMDYGGPNMAKPLHVGHFRPALIGESVKRILRFKNYHVLGDVHLGDAGLQVGQVIYGIKQDYKDVDPKDINLTLQYLNETYPKISALSKENENVLKACQNITKELQDGNEQYKILWQKIFDVSYQDLKSIYDYLNVHFDIWGGELETYQHMDELLTYLNKQNIITISNEMKVIEVKEETDKKEMPPFIIQRSDGAYIYSTTDLATIYLRIKQYDPKYIMYFVDDRQSLHFEQLFRAATKANLVDNTILEHNANGTINGPDNKPYKTRSGDTVKARDFINEVKDTFLNLREENTKMKEQDVDIIVNAIIKFGELQNARGNNYIFDLEKYSSTVGKTGPYLLYTYLRLNKLINQDINHLVIENNYSQDELNLKLKLLQVTNYLNKAADERRPDYIAEYLYDLAVTANVFYQNNNISKLEDENKKLNLMTLIKATTNTMKTLLDLLVIDIPEEM